jgi:hypothetical protein
VIKKVKCPTFLLHGMKDNLVSHTHSEKLCDACGGPSYLLLPEEMDHNNLDVVGDFVAPLGEFLDTFDILNMKDLPVKCLSEQESTTSLLSSLSNSNLQFQ